MGLGLEHALALIALWSNKKSSSVGSEVPAGDVRAVLAQC
jgi:hypothetical protein